VLANCIICVSKHHWADVTDHTAVFNNHTHKSHRLFHPGPHAVMTITSLLASEQTAKLLLSLIKIILIIHIMLLQLTLYHAGLTYEEDNLRK